MQYNKYAGAFWIDQICDTELHSLKMALEARTISSAGHQTLQN